MAHADNSPTVFSGEHCSIQIERPHPSVISLTICGRDVGEFGDAPFKAMEPAFEAGLPVEIFVNAWNVRSVTMEVSGVWAHWMMTHRQRIYRFNMLYRSKFVRMTAEFIQRFTTFGEQQMRIYSDDAAFKLALRVACGQVASVTGSEPGGC